MADTKQKATATIAPNKPVTANAKATSRWLVDAFNVSLRWIDVNLLPIFSLVLLSGLAAVGFSTFLAHLSYTWKVGISIAVAAFLATKTHSK